VASADLVGELRVLRGVFLDARPLASAEPGQERAGQHLDRVAVGAGIRHGSYLAEAAAQGGQDILPADARFRWVIRHRETRTE
jgi:hypothetical protein